MLFDINDFDETLPGPWEWDVKRLAASFEVLGRERGFDSADRRAIVSACVGEYRLVMRRTAGMRTLDAWYDHVDANQVLDFVRGEVSEKRLGEEEAEQAAEGHRQGEDPRPCPLARQANGRDRGRAPDRGRPAADRAARRPDARRRGTGRAHRLHGVARRRIPTVLRVVHHPFEEFKWVDTAHKVVGVGSVGTRAWIHLFLGRDADDPLFLQSKEAQASVLERFVGRSAFANHGRRVVAGQRVMQAASDIFLGWLRVKELDGDHARLLRASAARLEGRCRRRQHARSRRDALRALLRRDTRARPRALGRPDRDRVIPRQRRRLRSRDRRFRRGLRRTRTSATTRPSPPPSAPDGSKHEPACSTPMPVREAT